MNTPQLPPTNRTFSIRNISIIFNVIIRNRFSALPYFSFNIEQLAKRVKKATVLVIENDSTENTLYWFRVWKKRVIENPSLNILDVDVRSFEWKTPDKSLFILARARNEALRAVREKKYSGYDFFVIVDSDMCLRWDINHMEEILDSLLLTQGISWDAVFANGALNWDKDGWGDHYDRFAYRDDVIVWDPSKGILYEEGLNNRLFPSDIQFWWDNCFINPYNCTPLPGRYEKWDCHMVNGQPLVNVQSAFGGIGIYSTYLIYDHPGTQPCAYSTPYDDCEHIPFNMCLRERFNAKLVVAPRMIIAWGGCYGELGQYHSTAKQLIDNAKNYPPLLLQ